MTNKKLPLPEYFVQLRDYINGAPWIYVRWPDGVSGDTLIGHIIQGAANRSLGRPRWGTSDSCENRAPLAYFNGRAV